MSRNKVITIVVVLVVCAVSSIGGVAFYTTSVYNKNNQAPTATPTPTGMEVTSEITLAGAQKYTSKTFGFSMMVPATWKIGETTSEVSFTPDSNYGVVNFQVITDKSFSLIKSIDQTFCDNWTEAFKTSSGLDDATVAQFNFSLFSLNGNKACRASGNIATGVVRYYVFFDSSKNDIYSLFYLSEDSGVEAQLRQVQDSFSF